MYQGTTKEVESDNSLLYMIAHDDERIANKCVSCDQFVFRMNNDNQCCERFRHQEWARMISESYIDSARLSELDPVATQTEEEQKCEDDDSDLEILDYEPEIFQMRRQQEEREQELEDQKTECDFPPLPPLPTISEYSDGNIYDLRVEIPSPQVPLEPIEFDFDYEGYTDDEQDQESLSDFVVDTDEEHDYNDNQSQQSLDDLLSSVIQHQQQLAEQGSDGELYDVSHQFYGVGSQPRDL